MDFLTDCTHIIEGGYYAIPYIYITWAIAQPSTILLQVKDQITKLAKKGSTPSQIGVILRDSHGIAQVSCTLFSSIAETRLISVTSWYASSAHQFLLRGGIERAAYGDPKAEEVVESSGWIQRQHVSLIRCEAHFVR